MLAILIRDYSLEVVLDSSVISVIDFMEDLVTEARYIYIVDSWDTLEESVFILFMVAHGLLNLVHKLLDQVLTFSNLMVFKGKVNRLDRVLYLLVEQSLHQLVGEVVDVVDH